MREDAAVEEKQSKRESGQRPASRQMTTDAVRDARESNLNRSRIEFRGMVAYATKSAGR